MNMIQDKYKFVYVYTQIENVNENNLQSESILVSQKILLPWVRNYFLVQILGPNIEISKQLNLKCSICSEEPYKFEYIWDTRKLMKNLPIISWDMYIDYLRVEQKRHPQEQPEIYIDEVMAIQTDSGIGKALMK